jgi:hypothetical protein
VSPPVVLVPPAPEDPAPRRHVARALDDAGDHRLVRRRSLERDVAQRLAEAEHVRVGIDHPRDDDAPPEIDDAGLRAAQGDRLARGAGEEEAPVADGERLGHRARVVHGVDARVGDDQVGGARLGGGRLRRGERRDEQDGEQRGEQRAVHRLTV